MAALLLAALAPSVPAEGEGEPLLKDNAGDTVFNSGVPGAASTPANVAGQTESVDLVALHVEETDETLLLVLHAAKLDGNPGGEYTIHFTWRDAAYRAVAVRASNPFSSYAYAYLEASLEEDWERLAPLALEVDAAAGTLAMEVPKVFVLDGQKRAPGIGDTLTGIRAEARASTFRFRLINDDDYPASFSDVMPDDGAGVPLTFLLGDASHGGLTLKTDDRVRVSNGGSTTFVYRAELVNNGTRDQEITLTLVDMPESWNGSIQSPVRVPAGGQRSITVLASVPFEHKHGGHDSFQVAAQARDDPNVRATLRLGVVHTPIPQPAGHHAELYLHAVNEETGAFAQVFGPVFSFSNGFMNTESTHDGEAEGIGMNAYRSESRGWRIPLNPVLRMGLDFDVEKMGTLVGAVKGGANGEAVLAAKLFLVRYGEDGEEEGMLLAEGTGAKVVLDMQKATPFTLDLVPLPDADYVPYAKDQNLELQVMMKSDAAFISGFGPTEPILLAKDFKLTLPLNEYHDRLTGAAEAEEGLRLVADGPVEKTGRPGTVMTYAFDLKNAGRDVTIDLDAAGTDAALGVLVPSSTFELAAGATKRVTLAVQIPGDAATGEQLEVLVFAHAQEDPSMSAIVRTLTTVSTGANAADDETEVLLAARESEADAPGFGAIAAVLALAGLALVARRR